MKQCPTCGDPTLPNGAKFCCACGAALTEQPAAPESAVVEPEPFRATATERRALLPAYVIAYLYIQWMFGYHPENRIYLTVFGVLFCLGTELICWKRKPHWECYVYLACLWITLLCGCWGRNEVWGELSLLFTHAFAIYYVLVRSGRLLDGRTSCYAPLDILNGVIVFPFGQFFLRIRVLWHSLAGLLRRKANGRGRVGAVIAVVIGAVLLYMAISLLSGADATFDRLLGSLLQPDWSNWGDVLAKFLLSLPVGACLYGLVLGAQRRTPERMQAQKAGIDHWLAGLKKVPSGVWTAILAVFALVYLLFFCIQGTYLFGAFARELPEGYTVAEYARQGFFALCRVMALNFALAAIVWMSGDRRDRVQRIMLTVLLAMSLLFAVTAASKLWLYIDCFGFTPRRLQSAWLIACLSLGCGCAITTIWTGRKTLRFWALACCIGLSALCLW